MYGTCGLGHTICEGDATNDIQVCAILNKVRCYFFTVFCAAFDVTCDVDCSMTVIGRVIHYIIIPLYL